MVGLVVLAGDPIFVPSAGGTPRVITVANMAPEARGNFVFDVTARGRINGTVKRKSDPANLPLRRRVRLYRDVDGLLIREAWSDVGTGAYSFDYVETPWTYTVIAFDYEHNYRAVLADNLTPDLMP